MRGATRRAEVETTGGNTLSMLPKRPSKPTMVKTGVYVPEELLRQLDAIVATEKEKSRNAVAGSFLAFAVDLFPRIKGLLPQVDEVAAREGISQGQAIALLVERGLRAKR